VLKARVREQNAVDGRREHAAQAGARARAGGVRVAVAPDTPPATHARRGSRAASSNGSHQPQSRSNRTSSISTSVHSGASSAVNTGVTRTRGAATDMSATRPQDATS
jgi:hypothetical protein